MCQPLARWGCDVTLIAPGGEPDGTVALSARNPVIAAAGRKARAWLAFLAALDAEADIYHFHDPELIPVGLALKAKGKRVIYDVHEDYPAQMLVKYWIPTRLRPLVAQGMRLANALAGRYFDAVVTADPAVAQQFPTDKTLVFYNFPILDFFAGPEPVPVQHDVVYLGGMSERTGMFVLLDALAQLRDQGRIVTACLAGYADGNDGYAALMGGIRTRQLSGQVLVMGRLPHVQVPAYLRSGRIGVVPLQPIAKFLSNIPTKLFEYWACGLPVVVGTLPPILPFVRDGNNGLLYPPTSSTELAAQLAWLLDHPGAAQRMGQAGQAQVAKAWNNETQVTQLLGLYERLLNGTPSQMSPAGKRRYERLVPQ
jgi:hypothetical protein